MTRVIASIVLAICAATSCGTSDASADPPALAPHPTSPEEDRPSRAELIARHDAALARVAERHRELTAEYRQATTARAQAEVRSRARRVLESAIIDEVFPAWMGMPWGMGSDSIATRPHEPDMTVGCSYFVTSVLLSVGVTLDDRFAFAQSPALYIQRSLAPDAEDLHRYYSIPPTQLRDRIADLGPGLYIIGLDTHVGFVVVTENDVRLVHASYTGDRVVTDEPLARAQAIANSQPKGYFVTPLFQDGRLLDLWLRDRAVPLQKLGA